MSKIIHLFVVADYQPLLPVGIEHIEVAGITIVAGLVLLLLIVVFGKGIERLSKRAQRWVNRRIG